MSEKLLINDSKSNNFEIKSNNEIVSERYEIAEILAQNFRLNDEQYDASDFEWAAHCLLEAGYRKQIESKWVMIPVNGVARYRCGNIDCCRLIPFGCSPNELDYCPFCGARMKGGERDG